MRCCQRPIIANAPLPMDFFFKEMEHLIGILVWVVLDGDGNSIRD